jgi:hypothetical protein
MLAGCVRITSTWHVQGMHMNIKEALIAQLKRMPTQAAHTNMFIGITFRCFWLTDVIFAWFYMIAIDHKHRQRFQFLLHISGIN